MLNLINIITSEERNRDRFRFLLSLDNKVKKQIIYTQRYYTEVSGYRNTFVKTPPDKYKSGIKFWTWVLIDTTKLLKKSKEKWIVVEHLTGFVLFFLKLIRFSFPVKPVLIHGCYSESFFYLYQKVWRIDEPEWLFKKQNRYYLTRWRKRVFNESVYFWVADGVISNSPRMVTWINKHFHIPTFRILNAVIDKPHELCDSKRNVDVLYVGNLTPAKGVVCLLKALNEMDKKLKVVFVGKVKNQDKFWWKRVLKNFDKLNIDVHEHMKWEQLKVIYLKSKVFVLPSYSEGSPRVIMEALCYGCKIVASDIPGNTFPTDIKYNPITYYPEGDYSRLKERILTALEEPKADIKETSLFIEQFNEEEVRKDLVDFYKTF